MLAYPRTSDGLALAHLPGNPMNTTLGRNLPTPPSCNKDWQPSRRSSEMTVSKKPAVSLSWSGLDQYPCLNCEIGNVDFVSSFSSCRSMLPSVLKLLLFGAGSSSASASNLISKNLSKVVFNTLP